MIQDQLNINVTAPYEGAIIAFLNFLTELVRGMPVEDKAIHSKNWLEFWQKLDIKK